MIYVGGVGTGFKRTQAITLRRQLDAIRTTKPVVSTKGKNMVWVEPKLVAEVEYRGWTDDLRLRHASFKGSGISKTPEKSSRSIRCPLIAELSRLYEAHHPY